MRPDPQRDSGGGEPFTRRRLALSALLAAAAALGLYARTLGHEFVDVDLAPYLTQNPMVLAGLTWDGVVSAFTEVHAANWHPLTWMSHMVDVELFGLDPAGHHAVNALLHALSSALCVLVLARATGELGPSLVCALVFAVHPLHVESVAWVAERKDVLSGALGLASLLAWLGWSQRGSRTAWAASLLFFAAALASKPMLVTLPFVFLLLDHWPLARAAHGLRALVVEKLPFFALSALSAWITVLAQRSGGAVQSLEGLPLGERIATAAISWCTYLRRALWPSDLCFFHAYDRNAVEPWAAWSCAALLVLLSAIAWRERRRMPWLMSGWFAFLGMLVPVIGLVQVGSQATADRYMYLPLLPLTWAIVWCARELLQQRAWHAPLATAALFALGVVGWRQVGTWRDTESLARHALEVDAQNPVAHDLLGLALSRRGDHAGALRHREEALRIAPGNVEARANLAVTLFQLGRYDEAERELLTVLAARPSLSSAHAHLGAVLITLGRFAEARSHLEEAVRNGPGSGDAWTHLGYAREVGGDPVGALDAYRRALAFPPPDPRALLGLARGELARGDAAAARPLVERVLALDPRDPQALLQHAQVAQLAGAEHEALENLRRVRELRANWPEGALELAWFLANARDDALASPVHASELARALAPVLGSEDAGILDIEAALLARSGRHTDAAAKARTAASSARAAGDAIYAARIELRAARYAASRFERGTLR